LQLHREKKKYKTPKTLDPFAKVMGNNRGFEPIIVKEDILQRKSEEKDVQDDEDEAYVDEYPIPTVKASEYGYEAHSKFEEAKELGGTFGSKQGTLREELMRIEGGSKTSFGIRDMDEINKPLQRRAQSERFLDDVEEKAKMKGKGQISKRKTSNLEALMKESPEAKNLRKELLKAENEGDNGERSQAILDRLQRLLDDWEETTNINEREDNTDNGGRQTDQMYRDQERVKKNQSGKLFKQVGSNRSSSNRYPNDGNYK
jgi:hypothetical protein